MIKNTNTETKEYKLVLFSKIMRVISGVGTFLVFGGIFVFIGTFGYLKYVVWLPILFLFDILFSYIWYGYRVIYHIDALGFSIRNVPNSKVISWNDIQKVQAIKYGSKLIKLAIFGKGERRSIILGTDIHNHKELFEIILANTEGKIEERKKTFFIDY